MAQIKEKFQYWWQYKLESKVAFPYRCGGKNLIKENILHKPAGFSLEVHKTQDPHPKLMH